MSMMTPPSRVQKNFRSFDFPGPTSKKETLKSQEISSHVHVRVMVSEDQGKVICPEAMKGPCGQFDRWIRGEELRIDVGCVLVVY